MSDLQSIRRRTALVALALLFVSSLIAACRTAPRTPPVAAAAPPLPPTVIVISLDGWRWDYRTKASLPAMRRLEKTGVRAEALIPGFPSKTFPNHYTIVTGLYPGHHGVIGNSMTDPAIPARFALGNREQVANAAWWGGEPLWNTVIAQGRLASALFWPGSEAPIGGLRPTDWAVYDSSLPDETRVDRLLEWLDRPADRRPALLLTYFSDTDDAGHWNGPESPELVAALGRVDAALTRLLAGLDARGITDQVNVVLVSDHGMAATSRDRVIALSDHLDLDAVDVVDLNPNIAINPTAMPEEEVLRRLSGVRHLRVYRKGDAPEHWRFRTHRRVPAIVGVADEGWTIARRRPGATDRFPLGAHGYDPHVRSMHGLFLASGPAFRRGAVVPPFESVDVYDILAKVLGVTPAPNDGDPHAAGRVLR